MALTEQARKALNAKIEGHGAQAGVVLPSGLTKVSGGLIARPSTDRSGTRTGILAEEADEQKAAGEAKTPIPHEPEQPVLEQVQQEPQPRKRVRGSRKTGSAPVTAVKVELEIQGIGMLPSQYVHCHVGIGIVVLGLNEFSYTPAVAHYEGDRLVGIIQIKGVPGRQYCYLGNSFTDSAGVRNIILADFKNEETAE